MYIPSYFKNTDSKEVYDFIKDHSFGILLSSKSNHIQGTHIPIELQEDADGKKVLYGHISKANPQWKDFESNPEVLAIFTGPHAYVSSSWYEKENVPTWNYIAVHVYGIIELIEGQELYHSLKLLVDKYEQESVEPVKMEYLSDQTLKQMQGIVGFKITINEVQAAYKLSQNRTENDHQTIVENLKNSTDPLAHQIASKMEK